MILSLSDLSFAQDHWYREHPGCYPIPQVQQRLLSPFLGLSMVSPNLDSRKFRVDTVVQNFKNHYFPTGLVMSWAIHFEINPTALLQKTYTSCAWRYPGHAEF